MLKQTLSNLKSPFNYPLNLSVYPAQIEGNDGKVILCLHGYAANYQTGAVLSQNLPNYTVVSFDFPDANIRQRRSLDEISFGSIKEVLPGIFLANECIKRGKLDALSIYGFSAGGAAAVNMLSVLNTSTYDKHLAEIGVGKEDKQKILYAVQRGFVILDCPLKSIEEIIDFSGNSPELTIMARKYSDNGFTPLNSVNNLKGLSLRIVVNFQNPDEALSNRDDHIFLERLRIANSKGTTISVQSRDRGHVSYHPALWAAFKKLQGKDE